MDVATTVYFLVGVGIVLTFSVNYFNQPGYKFVEEKADAKYYQTDFMLDPALPKYMTDRFKYSLYLTAYILVTELIYLLLVLFLPDLLSTDDSPPLSMSRPNIVLAALIVTGISPNLPYIRQMLERSKLYLHEKAQIPTKGREVYNKLKKNTPQYARDKIDEILKEECYSRGGQNNKKRLDLTVSDFECDALLLQGRWAKLSYLIHHVNQWSKIAPFSSYIGNRELKNSSIQNAYDDDLQPNMSRFQSGELSEQEVLRLNGMVDATLHRTYRLISCLLYLAGKRDAVVDQFLDQLGYTNPNPDKASFRAPQMIRIKARHAGNGRPLSSVATLSRIICGAPSGRAAGRSSAALRRLPIAGYCYASAPCG